MPRKRRAPVIVALLSLLVVAASLGARPAALGGPASLPGFVRVWTIHYRAHDGQLRAASVDLPRWYGPGHDPPLPLVVSPGGLADRRAGGSVWGDLPALGRFAVATPAVVGESLAAASPADPGEIEDLARLPDALTEQLPWLRIDRRRVFAFGGGQGGQEALLLLARYPHLLAGVAAFDAPTSLPPSFHGGSRQLARLDVPLGRPPEGDAAPAAAASLAFARELAFAMVPLQLWWRDHPAADRDEQSGLLLYREIKRLNPRAPVEEVVERSGGPEQASTERLSVALLGFGLLPLPDAAREDAATSDFPRALESGIFVRRSFSLARPSPRPGPLAYHWPVRPFDRQHPVRGYFGDPRTVFGLASPDEPDAQGRFSFHNGIDIVTGVGTPVYPVVSGRVSRDDGYEVVVESEGDRTFQYWHISPAVRVGEWVAAEKTVLGYVRREAKHVHLTEIDAARVQNPLAPGHLTPYRDLTPPVVRALFLRDPGGNELSPLELRGRVEIVAEAYDRPALPVPGAWRGVPVAPALVGWTLTTPSGRPVIPRRVAADFRRSLPPRRRFWQVYAHGTYQNFPAIGLHYFFRSPGRYLFDLTPRLLDTSRLRPGSYLLRVTAADTLGNRASLTERVRILPGPERSRTEAVHAAG